MNIQLLGPMRVFLDSGQVAHLTEPQSRLLLALALSDGPLANDELTETLTNDVGTRPTERILDLHLRGLIDTLGGHHFTRTPSGTELIDIGDLDALDFEIEASAAFDMIDDGDLATAGALLRVCLGRWHGEIDHAPHAGATLHAVQRLNRRRDAVAEELAHLAHLRRPEPDFVDPVTTFVFTDIVGSTALWETVPDRMDTALQQHDQLISEAAALAGGRCLRHRGEGDSTFSVFDSPVAGVNAAVAMRRAMQAVVWPADAGLQVRASVYTGVAISRSNDFFGPTVNRAARLRGLAQPGQILVSGTTAGLIEGGLIERTALRRIGLLAMKGVADDEEVFELHDEAHVPRRVTTDENASSLDDEWKRLAASRRSTSTELVGRHDLLASQLQAFDRVRTGLSSVTLIGGDPGIGKTRLATELANRISDDGGVAALGRADAQQGIPYRAFAEALGDLVERAPRGVLEGYAREFGSELTRIAPALARRVAWLPEPVVTDSDSSRNRLFDAARGFLAHIAAAGPLVLVLDDLHDAGPETVQLAQYLLESIRSLPVQIVITYRDAEVSDDHPLARLLSSTRRHPNAEWVKLEGLQSDALGDLVELVAPKSPDRSELVDYLLDEAGGNPLFSIEVLRGLEGAADHSASERHGLPDTVRDVIGRRVARLGPEVETTLRAAAVVGREFDLSIVAAVRAITEDETLEAIEAAVAANLVDESDVAGRFIFSHGMIGQQLVMSMGATRRARTHAATADAIEAHWSARSIDTADAVATHLVAAGSFVAPQRVLAATRLAGDIALDGLAPDRAVEWYREALERADDDETRCDILIELGVAQRQSGSADFRATLLTAAQLARDIDDAERLMSAALANTRGERARTHFVDAERIAVLEQAIDATDGDDSASVAMALSLISLEMSHDRNWQQRMAYSDRALAMARRLDDRPTLCTVLRYRLSVTRLPETLDTRAHEAIEFVQLAILEGDPLQLAFAHLWLARTCMERGDLAGLDDNMAVAHELSTRVRDPLVAWNLAANTCYRAFMRGDIDEAEQLAMACFEIGVEGGQPDARSILITQLMMIREAQGRCAELVGPYRDASKSVADSSGLRAALTFVLAAAGEHDEASTLLDDFAAGGIASINRDTHWMPAMALLARSAARTQHRPAARGVLELLWPWRRHFVWTGAMVMGPVSVLIEPLAELLGELERARSLAQIGAEMSAAMECPVWLAESEAALSRLGQVMTGGPAS